MNVRPARDSDADAIASVLFDEGGFGFQQREDAEESRRRIRRQAAATVGNERASLLVAESGAGTVVGYTAVTWVTCLFLPGDEAYVTELFVRRAARGAGVGTALLDEVERIARERGCARLSLLNMRSKESYRRGYYAERGWRERTEAAAFVKMLD